MDISTIKTVGQLKAAGYISKSIKEELRDNLIQKLKQKEPVFEGIHGFEHTVLPDIERAILSRHNILLLGLRGQAKTRIARTIVTLLDEYMPIVAGSEINDDPLRPLSRYAVDLLDEQGDDTPIEWIHRSERFVEKLATPDVSVADLIGDVDPIKAASLKLPYSDERVIHFGLVPRSHRSIFVLNELPDLQARIQVSLFNILQENDLQIRGFKLRFPLDIQFVFTANPEDYTNRGSIVTPLKDRIQSQILTHYPQDVDIARRITQQEADILPAQNSRVTVIKDMQTLLELVAMHARESEYIDEKSGVSARMSISAMESLVSAAERRALMSGDAHTMARIGDFWGIVPAITGKVELVYEGEQLGPYEVAMLLVNAAIEEAFLQLYPHPDKKTEKYEPIRRWFSNGQTLTLLNDDNEETFRSKLDAVSGLRDLAQEHSSHDEEIYFLMELIIHGLAACEIIGRDVAEANLTFNDPLAGMFEDLDSDSGDE